MKRIVLGVLAGVCLIPVNASAGPINVGPFVGAAVQYSVTTTEGQDGTIFPFTLGSSLMSGGVDISDAINGLTFEAYCVEILGPIFNEPQQPGGGWLYDATADNMSNWDDQVSLTPDAELSGRYAAWLYNAFAASVADDDFTDAVDNGDDIGRAALQMAIWEVLYDTGFNLSAGLFTAFDNNDVVTRGNGYLTQLSLNLVEAAASDATLLRLRLNADPNSTDVQDFVGPLAQNPQPVPEPATLLLLASGVVAGGWQRRRKRA